MVDCMTEKALPGVRPQPMISVVDVGGSSRWYQHVLDPIDHCDTAYASSSTQFSAATTRLWTIQHEISRSCETRRANRSKMPA